MNDATPALIKRVEELESQVAFQDELNASLNTIVAKQDREIMLLQQQLSLLAKRLQEFGEALPGGGQQDETPPHY